MEKEVFSLVKRMNSTLSFVEDLNELKTKLQKSTSTIAEILQSIEACSQVIRGYIDSHSAGKNNNRRYFFI